MLNVDEIRTKWLNQCGYCDAGLPMTCTCPGDDPRHVILQLVREVEYLRSVNALMRSGNLSFRAPELPDYPSV